MKESRFTPPIRFKEFIDDWKQRKFSEEVILCRGLTYSPDDIRANGIRVLRSSNVNEDRFTTNEDDVFVDENAINIDYAQNGDILITSANGSTELVGKHAIIRDLPNNSAVHGGFMLLGRTPYPNFINASMSSPWYKNFIYTHVTGGNGAIGNLKKSELGDCRFMVPSISEQIKIGNFFEKLDSLVAFHQYKCETLKKYKTGYINSLIMNGKHAGRLGDLVEREDKTNIKSEEGKTDGEYPFFVNNTDESHKYLDTYNFDGEYIILNTGGEAYVRYYNGKFAAMSDCLVLRPREDCIALYYYLKSYEGIINCTGFQGTGLKHLDQDWLFNLDVKLPVVERDKINRIESLYSAIEKVAESKISLLNKIKNYLLQTMFI